MPPPSLSFLEQQGSWHLLSPCFLFQLLLTQGPWENNGAKGSRQTTCPFFWLPAHLPGQSQATGTCSTADEVAAPGGSWGRVTPQGSHSLATLALHHPSATALGIPQHKATLHCLDAGGDVPMRKGIQKYLCAGENRAERVTRADRKVAGQGFGGEKSFYCEFWPGWHPLPSIRVAGTEDNIK